jgi:phenylacetate-CoA ligase
MFATPELLEEATQPHRLADVLPRCLTEVPLYRRPEVVPVPTEPASVLAYLRRLPLITKQDLRRDFPHNFLGASADLESLLDQNILELEHTSGTSEERIPLLLPRGWWADQELRALRLNPLVAEVLASEPDARRVTISSPVCSGDICYVGFPSRIDRIVGQALFLSLSRYPFLWTEADLARMAAEAVEWRPRFLDLDPVYGVVFALYCERRGVRLPSLRFILSSYEFLSVVHRRILQRVFRVPVFDLYGSTETGHLLIEDEHGHMRPSLQTALLEAILPDPQGISELAVTTLTNPFMPLIRYRIGDLVERLEHPYATRYLLHGRSADVFRTPHGQRATTRQVDLCFAGFDGVAHYQLIQRPEHRWLLRFVPDGNGPDEQTKAQIQERLAELLQMDGPLILQPTEMLSPETSGKFKLGYSACTRPAPAGPHPAPARDTVGVCR